MHAHTHIQTRSSYVSAKTLVRRISNIITIVQEKVLCNLLWLKMPPKKKKQAKNAFYYFLLEFKEEAVKSGRDIDSPAFEEEADREWRNLNSERRFHYEEIAMEKRKKIDSLENKFTTTGVSYAQLQREERERLRREEIMINEIESTVRSLTGNTLKNEVFHFIHVNTYCRLLDGHYLPCEIGIAKFTFESGVKDCYHTIINLDCIPTGYFLECQKNSEETHQIPLPPENTLGESESEKILEQILTFLGENNVYPPVYTLQSNIEAAHDTLTTFASGDDIFRVYPIAKLLFELRNACANEAGGVGFPVLSLAEREFEKDFFNLSPGISCLYHEGIDACQYCSLSIVKRWCFLFASLGCPDLGIPLKPGNHKPRNITLPPAPPEPMTSKTQVSLRKGKKGVPIVEPPPITIIDYGSDSLEYSNGGEKSDSPLARFGTYIRVTDDEIIEETKEIQSSQINSYSEHFHNIVSDRDHDIFKCPVQSETTFCVGSKDNTVFSSQKFEHSFSVGEKNGPAIKTIGSNEVREQYHSLHFQSTSYENFSGGKIKIGQKQRDKTSNLHSQIAYEQDSYFQNTQLSSQKHPDIFDIYVQNMFQPLPAQEQVSDRSQSIITPENCSSSWKSSFCSSIQRGLTSSSLLRNNRNQHFMCGTDSIGHGRGISLDPEITDFSLIRPGNKNFCSLKTTSSQISASEKEEKPSHLVKNDVTPVVYMAGRSRGRARGLSLLLE